MEEKVGAGAAASRLVSSNCPWVAGKIVLPVELGGIDEYRDHDNTGGTGQTTRPTNQGSMSLVETPHCRDEHNPLMTSSLQPGDESSGRGRRLHERVRFLPAISREWPQERAT